MSLLFKDPTKMKEEFKQLHPELRFLAVDLDEWSIAAKIQQPIITEIFRPLDRNVAAYLVHWKGLRLELVNNGCIRDKNARIEVQNRREMASLCSRLRAQALVGSVLTGRVLPLEERIRAAGILSDAALKDDASARFSWHMVGCAMDLRMHHYTSKELEAVMGHLSRHCRNGSEWELVEDSVVAPCIHVARKDEEWRKRFLEAVNA